VGEDARLPNVLFFFKLNADRRLFATVTVMLRLLRSTARRQTKLTPTSGGMQASQTSSG